MATTRTYVVPFRRKRTGRTDYRVRRSLLASGKPRLVVRLSLKHVWAQLVRSSPSGDAVLLSAHSQELAKKGYKGGLNNTPAAYLVGCLLGKKALKQQVKSAVADIGMLQATKGARLFAVVKGAVDTGMDIPLDNAIVPDDKRMKGEHVAAYAVSLKADKTRYERQFSAYLKKGLRPEDLPKHIEDIKKGL